MTDDLNEIPFVHPGHGEFPEDTIVRDDDHAGGYTEYYVYEGRVLVEVRRSHSASPHYELIRSLKDKFDVEGPKVHWNPVDYRLDGGNTYSSVETPSKLVERS